MNRRVPPASDDRSLRSLLQEEAWLQRLARGLMADSSRAEDLAQDVMVAALESPPRAEGWGLRTWLATTARRMAARSSSRERARRTVEAEAAGRVDPDDPGAVNRRLEITESLVQGLQQIPEELRVAVVLRFLEGQEYAAMARRLGLSEGAVRQRVSRGLGELRGRLDAHHDGGRARWLPAVAAAAAQRTSVPLAAERFASTSLLFTLMTIKNAALILVAGLVALPLWMLIRSTPGVQPQPGSRVLVDAPGADVGFDDGQDRIKAATAAAAAATALDRQALRVGSAPQDAQPAAPPATLRVSVVDASGAWPTGVQAAWVQRDGTVELVELQEEAGVATGALPLGARGMVLASAPGLSLEAVGLDESRVASAALTLTLRPLQRLEGRVIVDGGPPAKPIDLHVFDDLRRLPLPELNDSPFVALGRLQRLGVIDRSVSWTKTLADGRFAFEGVDAAARGLISLPSSLVREGELNSRAFSYSMPSGPMTLRAKAGPFVFGQLLWADTDEPVRGAVFTKFLRRGTGMGRYESLRLLPEGRFEVGVPVEVNAAGAESFVHSTLSFTVDPEGAYAAAKPIELELTDLELPHDMGVIRIERSPMLRLQAVNEGQEIIADARVVGERWTSAEADDEGTLTVPLSMSQAFRVVAPGYLPRSLDPEVSGWNEAAGVATVTLEPSIALSISTTGHGSPHRSMPTLFVELEPDQVLLESGAGQDLWEGSQAWIDSNVEPFVSGRGVRMIHSPEAPSRGRLLTKCGDAPVVLGPFRRGARVEFGVLDVFGNELLRRRVELGDDPGVHNVQLDLAAAAGGALTVEVVDPAGAVIPAADVSARIPGVGSSGNDTSEGIIRFSTLASSGSYHLSARAAGFMEAKAEGSLSGGEQAVTVVMLPSRGLRLRIKDEAGRAQRPTRVDVVDESGQRYRGSERGEGAEFTWKELPRGGLTALVTFGPRTLSYPLAAGQDAGGEEAETLVVPAAGSIEGMLAQPLPVSDYGSEVRAEISVMADGRGGAQASAYRVQQSVQKDATGELSLVESLLPGRYSIAVDWLDFTGWDNGGVEGPHVRTPLFRGEVELKAGKVTVFRLEP